jgi:UDP-N-acetylglucosamine--dolichyl-phosphate N-acetylglucosaminephosphotransferase
MAVFGSPAVTAYIASGAFALLVTLVFMPRLIRQFKAYGMVGKDMNKSDQREVAEMGGVAVVAGFFAGVVVLMGFDSFSDQSIIPEMPLFLAALLACLGAAFVGVIDDVFELRQRVKALLPILFALPLGFVVINHTIRLPGGHLIDFGIFMIPLVAFMVSAGANAANMLEGFNGLGAGLGLIMATSFAVLAVYTARPEALLLLAPYFGATIALLWYNRYPAKVFPGDTFTLFSGATIVAAAVMVDLKEVGTLLFIPMIIEFILKSRHRYTKQTYGKPDEKGRLTYHGEVGSLTHLVMRGGANTERRVVWSLWGAEALIATAVVAFIVF